MIDFSYYANNSVDYVAHLLSISTDQAQKLINEMVKNDYTNLAQRIVDRDKNPIDPKGTKSVLIKLYEKLIHNYRYNQANIDEAVRYVCEDRCGLKANQDKTLAQMLKDVSIFISYRYGDSIAHCELDCADEIHKAINSIIRRTPDLKALVDQRKKEKYSRGENDYKAVYDNIYKYLQKHEYKAFTYNELSLTLELHCGTTRHVLRKLKEQGIIISYKPSDSRKKLVYKYADRGYAVCRYGASTNPELASVKMAAIKDVIVGIVKTQPGVRAKAIYGAVRNYYGKMDDKTTSKALLELVAEKRIIRELITSRGNVKSYAHHVDAREVDW